MALDLNMTAISQDVFPSLVASIGPVLDSAIKVSDDPAAKTVTVNIFDDVVGNEFTQSTGSYTETAVNNTGISVTMTEVYMIRKINKLAFIQTPMDVIKGLLPKIGVGIAKKMFAMQNALVTAAAYTNTALTSTAANFDADDVADLATSLDTANVPEMGRSLVVLPSYVGALSKDNTIQAAYSFGDDGVIKRNLIPSVHGFSVHKASSIAASGDVANLTGWAAGKEAFAVAFRPSMESADVPTYAAMGSYTDPKTSITITTKIWDGNDGNYRIGGFVGFGIARGQVAALTLIKSA